MAFFEAHNPTDEEITGIASYTIAPYEAAQYFNKIQCFCFEEQILKPGERVDMPVFFYLDPEFAVDPLMDDVKSIVLAYTFIDTRTAKELNMELPKSPHAYQVA